MIDKELLISDVERVRSLSPIVQNITNYVTMNNSANALLAIGASPIMAHAVEEMEQMAAITGALVINIGTLDSKWIESMLIAGKAVSRLGKPIVLDPVGAGASTLRTETAWKIIEECRPTIIRGNGSEIMALIDADVKSKGVDSSASSDSALDSAKLLAKRTGAVVVISGATDYITDGERVEMVTNGASIMTVVTAMGCTASSIVGAFAAINSDPFVAATNAMAVMGIAGEIAASYSKGSGSMQLNFLDELYSLSAEKIASTLK